MGFKGVATDANIEKIKQDFLNVLQWFKEKSLTPWYYGVKLYQANPRSLASAIGTSLKYETHVTLLNDQIQTINDARHQYTLQIKYDTKAVRLI